MLGIANNFGLDRDIFPESRATSYHGGLLGSDGQSGGGTRLIVDHLLQNGNSHGNQLSTPQRFTNMPRVAFREVQDKRLYPCVSCEPEHGGVYGEPRTKRGGLTQEY
ncbi:hypothetical protein J6590_104927 [Homalodisca vitripennis]|nr:hypothetical protein J6590_104927 [Homalodisca vitripennis]